MITLPLLHAGVGGPNWLDWSIHWDTILLCAALAFGYYYAATRLRPKVSDAARIKRSQVILFSLGVLALYVGGGTAIHDLGEEYLFTAHMVQHLLYTLVAPPLLIAGTPAWLWKWLLILPLPSTLMMAGFHRSASRVTVAISLIRMPVL